MNCVMSKVRGWFCFLCMESDHKNFRLCVSFVLLQYSAFVADRQPQTIHGTRVCLDSGKKMLLRESSSGNGLQPSFPDFNLRNLYLYPFALIVC